MSIKCFFGTHSWNGCICTACDKIRDEQHDFSMDCEKCSKCGKVKVNQHDWTQDCEQYNPYVLIRWLKLCIALINLKKVP